MIHTLDLYITSVKNSIKSLYEYRFDFWIGVFSFILLQIVGLGFIWLIYQYTPALSGWSLAEILLIYGFQELVKSVYLILFGGTTGLEQLIRRGDFDRFLVRPIHPLLQLMFTKIDPKGLGSLITGICLFIYAIDRVGLHLGLSGLLLMVVFLFAGVLIYFSLALITSTCAFWFTRTLRLHQLVFDFSEFTRYPIDIFHMGIQVILSVVIPFALASYYPAYYFLKGGDQGLALVMGISIGTSCFFLVAFTFWNCGLKYYHSTGS